MPIANSTDGDNHQATATQSDHKRPAEATTTQSNGVNTVSDGAAGPGDSGNSNSVTPNADNSGAATQPGSGTNAHPDSGSGSHSGTPAAGPNIGELVTAIQAMPESVVRAIREAQTPAKPPRQQAPAQDSAQQSNASQSGTQPGSQQSEQSRAPGKKSFTEWWFGK